MAEKEKKNITPTEYFEQVKELKNQNTDETLDKFYESALILLNKYKLTGQKRMIKKLMFVINCIPKERELVARGIDTFIYKDDIEEYINTVEGKAVKIIEMENFPREIPNELLSVIEDVKDIFDKLYVLFTDYNGKEEKRVTKERRDRDPILFGAFVKDSEMNDRFYYLGDWVDEYCDLTLEKMISQRGKDLTRTITTPINADELMAECSKLIESKSSISYQMIANTNDTIITSNMKENNGSKKPKLWDKVKSYLGNKKDDNKWMNV